MSSHSVGFRQEGGRADEKGLLLDGSAASRTPLPGGWSPSPDTCPDRESSPDLLVPRSPLSREPAAGRCSFRSTHSPGEARRRRAWREPAGAPPGLSPLSPPHEGSLCSGATASAGVLWPFWSHGKRLEKPGLSGLGREGRDLLNLQTLKCRLHPSLFPHPRPEERLLQGVRQVSVGDQASVQRQTAPAANRGRALRGSELPVPRSVQAEAGRRRQGLPYLRPRSGSLL